jgi:hypothetical protein
MMAAVTAPAPNAATTAGAIVTTDVTATRPTVRAANATETVNEGGFVDWLSDLAAAG